VLRRYVESNLVTESYDEVELWVKGLRLEKHDDKTRRWLVYAMAEFLGVSPNQIEIEFCDLNVDDDAPG
jgi:hypothetical protein